MYPLYRRVPYSNRKQCVIHNPYSINPLGYDRRYTQRESMSWEAQVRWSMKFIRRFFGQFIHDFFWVNRKIMIMLIWPNRGYAICHRTFQIGFSAVADVSGRVTNSWEKHRYEETRVHTSHFAILSAAVTVSFHRPNSPSMKLLWRTYRVAQKLVHVFYALTSSNIDRFQFFQCQNQKNICNNTATKDPTNLNCIPTLPCEMSVS